MRSKHPQQNTFKFVKKDGLYEKVPDGQNQTDQCLIFSSNFDSGNLRGCQVKHESPEETPVFSIQISADGVPFDRGHYRTWFYFSVHGFKPGESF